MIDVKDEVYLTFKETEINRISEVRRDNIINAFYDLKFHLYRFYEWELIINEELKNIIRNIQLSFEPNETFCLHLMYPEYEEEDDEIKIIINKEDDLRIVGIVTLKYLEY